MNRRNMSLSHRSSKASLPTAATAPTGEASSAAAEETLRYNECQEAVEKLTEFLSHELVEAEQGDLQAHLKDCKGCFDKFAFEETLLRTIRERANQIVAPAPLRERILTMLDAEAAAPLPLINGGQGGLPPTAR